MKTLVICRHAKADYPSDTADFDRPLKEKGIKDAEYMGELLSDHNFSPDLIISSPALRAFSTAKIVAEAVKYPIKDIQTHPDIYHEGPGSLLDMIEDIPKEVQSVMIFGHNPTLSDFVRAILKMYHPFDMPTSAMVCIENPFNNWDFSMPQSGRLRWMIIPRLKRKDSGDE
ncbi:MAG: histidine phosphatase family protein [Bacteroidia bacterium]|nr:histidine phosphatase family protein [Bacteroidia bacterium]